MSPWIKKVKLNAKQAQQWVESHQADNDSITEQITAKKLTGQYTPKQTVRDSEKVIQTETIVITANSDEQQGHWQ